MSAHPETQGDGDEQLTPPRLNRTAVVGVAVSALVAAIGLFLLPTLRAAGWSFQLAFWVLVGIEFLAAIGVTISVMHLHED